jgi:predicted nucleotidyltransferase
VRDRHGLADRVIALLQQHPAVRWARLTGSRERGDTTALSDWDIEVDVDDFESYVTDLPSLMAELEPLAGQWDRLSDRWDYMVMLSGPVKIDVILDRPHEKREPWALSADTLPEIDHHFWDWALWLGSKQLRGLDEVVTTELQKLFAHLLRPMGVEEPPRGLTQAVEAYLAAQGRAERRFEIRVDPRMRQEVTRALEEAGLATFGATSAGAP